MFTRLISLGSFLAIIILKHTVEVFLRWAIPQAGHRKASLADLALGSTILISSSTCHNSSCHEEISAVSNRFFGTRLHSNYYYYYLLWCYSLQY
jgi:hypothetical protein